jgi:hypothetical protein
VFIVVRYLLVDMVSGIGFVAVGCCPVFRVENLHGPDPLSLLLLPTRCVR